MGNSWPRLDDDQRLAWLRLIRTPRVGPALFQDLLNHCGSAQAALDALPELSKRRQKPLSPPSLGQVEAEWNAARAMGATYVAKGEPDYPALLAKTYRPPPLLCALLNDAGVAAKPAVAMVGARNASAGGLNLARSMARELGEAGMVVVSGLARGIDAAAHLGALDTGTIAFLAGGLATPYPPEHGDLMAQIAAKGGAVYSETPLDWSARAQDFPRRNRLVAGASLGLVVVEAAKRSGSLITAEQARDLGREVMAVPGFPLDPRSEGPNALLREGARLVTNAQEVLEELKPMLKTPRAWQQLDDSDPSPTLPLEENEHGAEDYVADLQASDEAQLESAMGHSPVSADDLIEATGLSTSAVRVWLIENEIAGHITRAPGDRYAWAPPSLELASN